MASISFLLGILLVYFICLLQGSLGFICPGPVNPSQGFSYARIETNISGRASQDYANIRIKIFYRPSIEDKPYKELVQVAADFFSNVLSVKPVNGRLFKSRDCESDNGHIYRDLNGSGKKEKYCLGYCKEATQCKEINVPEEHLDGCKYCTKGGENCSNDEPDPGSGVENADIVVYISAIDTRTCLYSGAVAYAGICELEPILDRPVFARINICPTQADSHSNDSQVILKTMKHEMMHALGFGFDTFKLFRDKEGKPLWPRDEDGQPIVNENNVKQKVTMTIAREWHVRGDPIYSERVFLVTPNVAREARAHFGCPDLEGAELEDYGRSGSRNQHFEARVFYDDVMKANVDTGKQLFSRLDFAVLDDSGWYKVDYSQAEEMDFGRNLGCDFCMKSCKFWMDKKRKEGQSLNPYCDSPDLEKLQGVTYNGSKKLFSGCPLRKLSLITLELVQDPKSFERVSGLPRKYQHFDQISGVDDHEVARFGSIDAPADFCPVPLQNADVTEELDDDFDIEEEATLDPWEPNPTRKPLKSNPPKKPEPVEQAKNDGDETNQSSNLCLCAPLVILLPIAMVSRAIFKFSYKVDFY